MSPGAGAVRQAEGFLEEADLVGPGLFGHRYLPDQPSGTGVVICSPIYAEYFKNYRREVLLARALAAAGAAVQRFQYRNTGLSDDVPGGMTVASMTDDADAAAGALAERCRPDRMILMGVRWGGIVAARAAVRRGGAPLVLWDPVIDPAGYLADIIRVRQVQELTSGADKRHSGSDLVTMLENEGSLVVLDYLIERDLHRSVAPIDVPRLISEAASEAALVLQVSRRSELAEDLALVAAGWQDAGVEVTASSTGHEEAWWFEADRFETEENKMLTRLLIDQTVAWVENLGAGR